MTTPTRTAQDVAASSSSTSSSAATAAQSPPSHGHHGRTAVVVAASLGAGLVAAVGLAAAPVVPATESALTGAVLFGFAIGWAVLAGLSARFTPQPQRWALVPAAVFGVGGLGLLALGSSAHPAVDWVWPPVLVGLALWTAARIRRDLAGRAARWMLVPVIAAIGLAGVGGAYQTVGTATAPPSRMPGRLVDVGGHRLHLSCSGTGSPTVVVEAGGGEMAANLGWITSVVARDTTICVYDRAGRGWSEDADTPQDAVAISTDLHTLLHRAGIVGPYVMAGHSFGGLYALTFAAHHPDEVAGLVLVDSTSPHYGDAVGAAPAPGSYDVVRRVAALTSSVARVGVGRLYSTIAAVDLPPRELRDLRASTATAATLRSTIEEYARANASMVQAGALRDFGDKPLVVLTAGVGSATDWPQKQERLAALSTDSVHRVVAGASHEALVGDPTHAADTSRAVLEVVAAVRSGRPLSP